MINKQLLSVIFLIFATGTSISLSPLGMVSVCPGGQVLLTCERTSGSSLYWDVSSPHLAGATIRPRLVLNEGVIISPVFKIGFTEFNITRTSESPLISQLMINNVTTEINESTIYCSEDSNGNNASMTAINVIGGIAKLKHGLMNRVALFHLIHR